MASYLSLTAVTALLMTSASLTAAQTSGSGSTTRYWDCCKPSCAWNDLSTLGITSAVQSCDINDNPLKDTSTQSGCNGGTAFMCSNQTPWEITPILAYGFAAVSAASSDCCQCYQLTFTSGPITGNQMIVQATNTGSDVGSTQFDIAMPGGGFGIFDGCTNEWGATSAIWGAQYGGSSTNTCSTFPALLQPGCDFRWGWFKGADNPTVNWEKVSCPAAITAKSGCVRVGDTPTGPASVSSVVPAPSSTTSPVSTSAAPVSVSSSSSSSPAPSSSSSSLTLAPAPSSTISASTLLMSVISVPASSIAPPEPTQTGGDSCEL